MRNGSSALFTALSQSVVEDLFFAVEMLFDSGPVRFWSGVGPRTVSGKTFLGTGSLISIGSLSEASDLSSRGASINISGVDGSMISTALQEPYQNRTCNIYLGSATNLILVFSGFMDVMSIIDAGDKSVISISVENRLTLLDRVVPRRYSNESQKARFSGDTFFSYVSSLQDKQIVWGRSNP